MEEETGLIKVKPNILIQITYHSHKKDLQESDQKPQHAAYPVKLLSIRRNQVYNVASCCTCQCCTAQSQHLGLQRKASQNVIISDLLFNYTVQSNLRSWPPLVCDHVSSRTSFGQITIFKTSCK